MMRAEEERNKGKGRREQWSTLRDSSLETFVLGEHFHMFKNKIISFIYLGLILKKSECISSNNWNEPAHFLVAFFN